MHQQVKTHWDALRWLKIYGYLPEVPLKDLCKNKGKKLQKSVVVRESLKLAQSAFYTESQMGCPDGILGECTQSGMSQMRCGHPDFADEELASLSCESLKEYARSFSSSVDELTTLSDLHKGAAYAAGSGSWPQPCQKGGVTVSMDTRRAPRGLDTEKLLEELFKVYRDVGLNLVKHDGSGQANIRISWRVLSGSTIGLAQFNSQRCNDSVFCYLDPGYFPNFIQVGELLKHELGHNDNLPHTRGGTMNPSILRVNDLAWKRTDPSWRRLERFHDAEPIDPTPDPSPTPGPDVGQGWFFVGRKMYALKVGDGDDGQLSFKGERYPLDVIRVA